MENNFKHWANFAEQNMTHKVKPEDLIFVVGYVKTSQWVRLALKERGTYTFDVNPESYGITTLKLGDELVKDEDVVEVQGDNSEKYFNDIQQTFKDRGIIPSVDEFPRRHCLFLLGWKMDKGSLLSPRKIVAAGKPEDLSRDGPSGWRGPVALTSSFVDEIPYADGWQAMLQPDPFFGEFILPLSCLFDDTTSFSTDSAWGTRTAPPTSSCGRSTRVDLFHHPSPLSPSIVS